MRKMMLVMLVLVALLLAACGGGDDEGSSQPVETESGPTASSLPATWTPQPTLDRTAIMATATWQSSDPGMTQAAVEAATAEVAVTLTLDAAATLEAVATEDAATGDDGAADEGTDGTDADGADGDDGADSADGTDGSGDGAGDGGAGSADDGSGDADSGDGSGGSNDSGEDEERFPATWTPAPTRAPRATSTSGPAPTSAGSVNQPTAAPLGPTWTPQPDYCYDLVPRSTDINILVGESVTIRWDTIGVIDNYLVTVRHPGGVLVFSRITEQDMMIFPSSVFDQAVAYGWQVQPLDAAGQPTCFPISGEIIVTFN